MECSQLCIGERNATYIYERPVSDSVWQNEDWVRNYNLALQQTKQVAQENLQQTKQLAQELQQTKQLAQENKVLVAIEFPKSQEMEYPNLLCHHPEQFANIKYPTLLSSHRDGETRATMTKVGDTGATGAIESTWGNQISGVTTTTAGKSKTLDAVDASSVRLPIVHPNDVHRCLRMNDMVHAVRKAWAPKGHHRHVSLQNQKRILLEEVRPTTSCKHELATTTCCSLSGMKKLFSVFMLPWTHGADASLELENIRTDLRRGHFPCHVQHDELESFSLPEPFSLPESRNEDSVA